MKILHVRQDQNHMATTFSLAISCAEPRVGAASAALREAHAEISRLEEALTEFRPSSPIYRLNEALPFSAVELTPEGTALLERCERLRQLTAGAFDCCAKSSGRPEQGPGVAWEGLHAWRLHPGVRVGFGAIGKGYALDRVRAMLEAQGFDDYCLSAGGSSIVLSGLAAPGEPWRWGWSWKKDEQGAPLGIPFEHSSAARIAIGVSGMQEKGAHLLDPRAASATFKASGMQSALVAVPSAADADALSTALYVAGYEAATRFMGELPCSPALAKIADDGTPAWNGIFRHHWGAIAGAARQATVALACALALGLAAWALPASAQADGPAAPTAVDSATASGADGAVDLGGMSADSFNPYVNERSPWWALLPVGALSLVILHLRKNRRSPVKAKSPASATPARMLLATAMLWGTLEQAHAVDLIPMGKALITVLGTPKAFQKKIGDSTLFYSKNGQGRADRVAFIVKNTWQKSCTHTWIVGVGPDGKVTQIVAQEQQCPHAKPSAADSFLDQYKGKGPADMAKLKSEVTTIAKATGSCDLATEAVVQSVTTYQKIKGQI